VYGISGGASVGSLFSACKFQAVLPLEACFLHISFRRCFL